MTVQTLRPNGTAAAGSFSAIPSGTLNGVTSDNSDSTYARGTGTLNSPMILDLGGYTLTSNERVKVIRARVRYSSNVGGNSATGTVQVSSGGLVALLNLPSSSVTTPADASTGWQTPTVEVTNSAIVDATLRTAQTINSAVGLRVYELYLDLDVRARPIVNAVTVDLNLGEPTYNVDFTYGTSGNSESVLVQAVVTDADGAVVATLTQTVVGTDFSGYDVSIDHGEVLPAGDYTVTVTVLAGGFVAPSTTFDSAPVMIQFSVTPSGVEGPILTCETDQDAQTVSLTICQPDSSSPSDVDCLIIGMAEFNVTTGVNLDNVSAPNAPVCHVSTWFQPDGDSSSYLIDIEIVVIDENVTWAGTFPSDGTLRVVYAYTEPGGVSNNVLIAQQLSGPGDIVHGLNTVDVIVQARDALTGLQSEIGVQQIGVNTLRITGPFSSSISVLILAPVPEGEEFCVPNIDVSVPDTGDTVVHQFNSIFTLATFFTTAGVLAWPEIQLNSAEIVVGPSTSGGTVHVSGTLATFDNPDAVRVEVQRDNVDIPLNGENGALVPPFGDGCIVVVDRFPLRYAAPTCVDDDEPAGPVYRARFYGYVDSIPSYSPWTICQPDAVIHNGQALLRSPVDPDLDVMACASSEDFTRVRPRNVVQPVNGGMPYGRIAPWSGRNFVIVLEAPNTAALKTYENVFADSYFWYSPLNSELEPLWLMPGAELPASGYKHPERPYTVTESTTNIEPDPVILPPFGITS